MSPCVMWLAMVNSVVCETETTVHCTVDKHIDSIRVNKSSIGDQFARVTFAVVPTSHSNVAAVSHPSGTCC